MKELLKKKNSATRRTSEHPYTKIWWDALGWPISQWLFPENCCGLKYSLDKALSAGLREVQIKPLIDSPFETNFRIFLLSNCNSAAGRKNQSNLVPESDGPIRERFLAGIARC